MKQKFLFCLFLVIAFSPAAFAQSIIIKPKKVTYTRPKPIDEYKKSFVVIYPKVKASTLALSKKIENAISYEKAANISIKDEMGENQWLEIASYKVDYNKNGILEITLSAEGMAAYPSSFDATVVVDLRTGNRDRAVDVFTNLAALAAKGRKAQQAEIKKANADYKKNPETADYDASMYFDEAKFAIKELDDFAFSDKGVTFIYDYGFAHVVEALQPEGRYFFTWAEMKPFIKSGGLFGKFVR